VQDHPLISAQENRLEIVKALFAQAAQRMTPILGIEYTDPSTFPTARYAAIVGDRQEIALFISFFTGLPAGRRLEGFIRYFKKKTKIQESSQDQHGSH
jgi:hypothetical protein